MIRRSLVNGSIKQQNVQHGSNDFLFHTRKKAPSPFMRLLGFLGGAYKRQILPAAKEFLS